MPFGFTNAGTNIQREMDVTFADFIGKFMVVYQDDLTTYSKKGKDHFKYLEKIFIRALEYDVSLIQRK